MKNTTAAQVKEEQSQITVHNVDHGGPTDLIAMAMDKGVDLEKLEKVLALKMKWEENEAKKAYVQAMAAFKANPPKIEKDKEVKFESGKGKTQYFHASLSNVTEKINAALSVHGLSAAWITSQNGQVSVTCTITHKLGHSESTTLSAPADQSGAKNSIQAIGSTITYLQRYTLLALTGLATHDQDDDGRGADGYISFDHAAQIEQLIAETKTDVKKFLAYIGGETIDRIPTKKYQMALAALENKKKGAAHASGK